MFERLDLRLALLVDPKQLVDAGFGMVERGLALPQAGDASLVVLEGLVQAELALLQLLDD